MLEAGTIPDELFPETIDGEQGIDHELEEVVEEKEDKLFLEGRRADD